MVHVDLWYLGGAYLTFKIWKLSSIGVMDTSLGDTSALIGQGWCQKGLAPTGAKPFWHHHWTIHINFSCRAEWLMVKFIPSVCCKWVKVQKIKTSTVVNITSLLQSLCWCSGQALVTDSVSTDNMHNVNTKAFINYIPDKHSTRVISQTGNS